MLIALLLALALDESPAAPTPAPAPAPQPQIAAPRLVIRPEALAPQPFQDLRFVWREHPSVRSRNLFRIDFAAKMQLDARDPGDDPQDFDTVELHRMRVGIEGDVFERIQYNVERELTENEIGDAPAGTRKSAWKDVWVEANYFNEAQFRFGKFKIPYGLDQTSGEADLDFVYRSLGGRYLSPGRDVGGMVHGRFFDRGLNYWTGVFKQDGENSRTSKIEGADTTVAVRVTGTPFRRAGFLKGAELGGSYAWSDLANESVYPNGLRGRTVMSQYVFFEPVFVNGHRRRLGVDVDWTAGPFGLRAEYMDVSDSREIQGLGDEDLHPARGKAWYVTGTWVVTGETKTRPVEAQSGGVFRGGFGAVELAARYDRLAFNSETGDDVPFRNPRAVVIYPNADDVVTLGVNYYVNRWIKLQLNGIHEHLDDVERSPIADGSAFWSTVFRMQLQL